MVFYPTAELQKHRRTSLSIRSKPPCWLVRHVVRMVSVYAYARLGFEADPFCSIGTAGTAYRRRSTNLRISSRTLLHD